MGIFSKKDKTESIIIVGCGRLGSSLADQLSSENKNVTIIDINEKAFRRLPLSYGGLTVEGDGTDMDVLTSCKGKETDILIACTDNDDINIMAAQLAKQIFKIKKVIVRIQDHSKQVTYADLGIESICPALLSIREFERIIAKEIPPSDESAKENK